MNRREAVLGLPDGKAESTYVPAGFFIHFDEKFHRGKAAVDKHLEYFEYTGMDVVKIQHEAKFPHQPEIEQPADWKKLERYGIDFFANQLEIVRGIVEAAGADAVVVQTIYSPFMQARFVTSPEIIKRHIQEDPEAVKAALEIVTESLMAYVKECVRLGVDGFYASTQGGDVNMFAGSPRFDECIKPFDLALMREMERTCRFNILHVCDFHGGYRDLDAFRDYPGHVVSTPGHVEQESSNPMRHPEIFGGRPLLGGLDRHGVIVTGTEAEIAAEVDRVLDAAPKPFFLGADCTLPNDVRWANIRAAIRAAHARG